MRNSYGKFYLFAETHEEVIWFHVPMDEIFPMDKFNTADLNKKKLQYMWQRKISPQKLN
jgi:hypothetical protein